MLEEGLETKSKGAPKTTDKSTTNKKKSSAMFCKPYFKDKDQKVFTVDVNGRDKNSEFYVMNSERFTIIINKQ